MISEWRSVRLGDVTDLLTGFPFESERYTDDPSAPRLLRGDNVVQGNFRWEGVKRWAQEQTDRIEDYWLREGDVILAMDRPWIEAGLKYAAIRACDLPAILVQRVARLRGTHGVDTRFLKYVIGSRAFTEYVLAVQTGTAVPHISGGQIRSFDFSLPTLLEQRAIAHILGSLDDKIELNRRMNETLEAIARALFESWFVDLDPVSGVESDSVRPWRMGKLSELAVVSRNGIDPGLSPAESFDHYSIPAFDSGRLPNVDPGDSIKSAKLIVPSDAVLLSKLNPEISRIWMPSVGTERRSICSTEFLVLQPTAVCSREYLYALVSSSAFLAEFVGFVTGGTNSHQRVRADDALSTPVLIPDNKSIQRFTSVAAPIFKRIASNRRESLSLAKLRDTLLPKLISGEVRVEATDRIAIEPIR